ncbi:MAG: type II toxin-antitoxin system HicA family toxin [Candidatus Xenobia bacterium]
MPPKIRELKERLRNAGFERRSGKGSHTVWVHTAVPGGVVLSGHDGDDAKRYQELLVDEAIARVERQR